MIKVVIYIIKATAYKANVQHFWEKKVCRYKITSLIRVLLFHLNAKRRAAAYLGVEHIDFAVVVFFHNPFGQR